VKEAAKPLVYIFLIFFMIPAYLFSGFLISTIVSMQNTSNLAALAEAFNEQEALASAISFLFILISAYMIFVEEKKSKFFKVIILFGLILMLCITLSSYILPEQYFSMGDGGIEDKHSIADLRKTFLDYTSNIVVLWFLAHGVDINKRLSTERDVQSD